MMIKNLNLRPVEGGKIKIGGKGAKKQSQSGGEYRVPQKWDHIVITTLERDANGDFKPDAALMAKLVSLSGSTDKKLREIPIALMSDEIEDCLQSAHVLYVGRQRLAQCDGETVTWYADPNSKQEYPEPRVGKCNGEHEKKGWKPHATFSCMIAAGEARFGVVYKLRTTSIISLERLVSSLQAVKALTRGFLCGAPLRLVLSPVEVSPEGKSSTVYCVHVELRGQDLSQVQQQVITAGQTQRANAKELESLQKMLRAPGAADEPAEEQADVAEEFEPGPENATPPADEPEPPAEEPPPAPRAAALTPLPSKANGAAKPASASELDGLPF